MIPHAYCFHGMTTCRGMFDILGIPYVGNPAQPMAVSTDKWQTRVLMASAGVPVAEGELLRRGDAPRMAPPFVLKPCREDNSQGVALYRGDGSDKRTLQE